MFLLRSFQLKKKIFVKRSSFTGKLSRVNLQNGCRNRPQAVLNGLFIGSLSLLGVVRELSGPLDNAYLISSIFVSFQYLYTFMLSCIVSLQVQQPFSYCLYKKLDLLLYWIELFFKVETGKLFGLTM